MSGATSGAIVVLAKAPLPGRVKTRMTPPLTERQASDLYAALLADVLATTAAFAADLDLEPLLAVYPAAACPLLAREAPPAFRVVAQRGADLAERMDWAAREAAATGAAPILLRGSDSPVLGGGIARAALEALEECDVVLAPDRDGGYSLVGLRRPAPGLFSHPMSTRSVLEDTLANARSLGLRAQMLDASFDLDTAEDLRWLAQVRSEAVTQLCPRTLAFLDEHRLWAIAGAP